jgi:hypothetical protein
LALAFSAARCNGQAFTKHQKTRFPAGFLFYDYSVPSRELDFWLRVLYLLLFVWNPVGVKGIGAGSGMTGLFSVFFVRFFPDNMALLKAKDSFLVQFLESQAVDFLGLRHRLAV